MSRRSPLPRCLLPLALLAAGCAPHDDPAVRIRERVRAMGARELAAQLVVPPLPSVADSGRLVVAELDGGAPGGTPFPPVALLAALAPPEDLRAAGRVVAREAREAGVSLGVVGTPPLTGTGQLPLASRDPERAAAGLAAFVEGAGDEGLAVAVRILRPADPDAPPLDWDRARLEAVDLPVVRAALGAGPAAVVLGAARLPSLTGDSLPLPLSPAATRGLLRRDLGWSGVIAVDLGAGTALARRAGAGEAAVRALAAGADLLLAPEHPDSVVAAVVAAVEGGRLPRERLASAAERVLALRSRLPGAGRTGPDPLPLRTRDPEATALAERLTLALALDHEAAERVPSFRWPPAPVLRPVEPAEVGMDAEALERVDRVIEEAVEDSVFSGAAVAVGRRGGLVKLRGYGRISDGDGAAPVSAETTLFDLASLSKVVGTTTAVALLVDAGHMRLDAPLRRYLPDFRGEGKEEVTVRRLLSHTSGLPSGLWLYGSADSPREALHRVVRQPLSRPPGSRMEYSDLGMILLAEAAERAAGMPLDRLLALRVFAPLGMASTMYLPPSFLRDRIVPTAATNERGLVLRGVVHDANAFRLGGVAGHAGIFSTARDVAVFAQTMLNGGSYGTAEVVSPETAAAFTRRQPGAEERALGWDTPSRRSSAGRYFSERSFGHTGYTGTSLWIDPEKELFVVLLTNRTYTEASAGEMLEVRAEVHDAAARSIRDRPVAPRPGAR